MFSFIKVAKLKRINLFIHSFIQANLFYAKVAQETKFGNSEIGYINPVKIFGYFSKYRWADAEGYLPCLSVVLVWCKDEYAPYMELGLVGDRFKGRQI